MTPEEKEYIVNKNPIGANYVNAGYKIVEFPYNDEGDNAYALVKIRSKKIISYSLSGQAERKHFSRLAKGIGLKKTTETLLRKKVNSILENMLNESDSGSNSQYKTQQWLKSFLNSTKVKYTLMRDTLILQDDMYRVELKVIGGSNYKSSLAHQDYSDDTDAE